MYTLFYTVPSLPSLELSTSLVALATIPSFTKTLQVYYLLAARLSSAFPKPGLGKYVYIARLPATSCSLLLFSLV